MVNLYSGTQTLLTQDIYDAIHDAEPGDDALRVDPTVNAFEGPSLCPSCGRDMRVVSALASPNQDDVIERILKSRGDPSWKRQRRGAWASEGARARSRGV